MNQNSSRTKPEWRSVLKSQGDYHQLDNDEIRGLPQPPLVKAPVSPILYNLPKDFSNLEISSDLLHVFETRRSHRLFTGEPLSLPQLGFLLWNTQGIKVVKGNNYASLRTVPSAGARHALETYLVIRNVESLPAGIYHYLPLTHQLEQLDVLHESNYNLVQNAIQNLPWSELASVVFFWSAVPYRMEWRYPDDAVKDILIDVGHVCQNLYLGCEAMNLGVCAIESYGQTAADQLFQLDGSDEFIIYAAPVGKKKVHR